MNLRMRRPAAAAIGLLLLAACQAAPSSGDAGSNGVSAVATTTVLADLVASVGGDRVAVESLIPPGGEVHTFDPRPSDVQRVADATVVFSNGLGLDAWIEDFVADVGRTDDLVAVGEDLDGVAYREGGHDDAHDEDEAHDEGEEHEAVDPHVWLNAEYAAAYVDRIATALTEVDPAGASTYEANAAAYRTELEALHRELVDAFAAIPEESRRVVSFHDAFGYFADAYGLEVIDTVIEAPGQDPSAGEVADLVDLVRTEGVAAILAEAQFPTDLAQRIADETGTRVVSGLHSDSVGEAEAATYVGMMRANAEAITAVLRDGG